MRVLLCFGNAQVAHAELRHDIRENVLQGLHRYDVWQCELLVVARHADVFQVLRNTLSRDNVVEPSCVGQVPPRLWSESALASQRTREMGVRMALGASEKRILRLVLGEGGRLAILGAALGIAGSLAATRLIRSLLFETVPNDPLTFVITPLLLASVAMLATYIPARRATKLDPTLAIRGE